MLLWLYDFPLHHSVKLTLNISIGRGARWNWTAYWTHAALALVLHISIYNCSFYLYLMKTLLAHQQNVYGVGTQATIASLPGPHGELNRCYSSVQRCHRLAEVSQLLVQYSCSSKDFVYIIYFILENVLKGYPFVYLSKNICWISILYLPILALEFRSCQARTGVINNWPANNQQHGYSVSPIPPW